MDGRIKGQLIKIVGNKNVTDARQIIRKLAPNFVELPHHREEALCCGAGSGMRGAYPGNSIARPDGV